MSGGLRCDVGDHFFVNAAFDDESTHDEFKAICIKLFHEDDGETIFGKKSFRWPERNFPSEMKYDETNGDLSLKGANNVAHIPFRLSEAVRARRSARASTAAAPLYSSLSSSCVQSQQSQLVSVIFDIANNKDRKNLWSSLCSSCCEESAACSSGVAIEGGVAPLALSLPRSVQCALVDFLCERTDRDEHFRSVLSTLIRRHSFSCFEVDLKLLELFAREQLFDFAAEFVRSRRLLGEEAYVVGLSFASQGIESKKDRGLLEALLAKGVDDLTAIESLSRRLSEANVIVLVEELTEVIATATSDTLFRNALDLLSLLLNSHSQRFVWDKQSCEPLTKAANVISDLVQSLDAFGRLNARMSQKCLTKDCERRCDYTIRKVRFEIKPL